MLNNKYDFTFFIQAKNCNPNGDPDMGNIPRTDDEDMHGYITDVAIKRKIRDYIENAYAGVAGKEIIIRDGSSINKSIAEVVLSDGDIKVNKKKQKNANIVSTQKKACDRFYDVRTFGAVLSTGLNAGQIKGPVQFEFGRSLDPIMVKDITITRVCYTSKEGDIKDLTDLNAYDKFDATLDPNQKRTMGRKQFIPYGLYQVHGYISAGLANKTGFSEDDLKVLFEAILNMYSSFSSATKAGMAVVGPIIIFKHVGITSDNEADKKIRESILGCAPAHKLHELIKISKKEGIEYPRDYKDYNLSINTKELPSGVQIGFKYMPFEDIVWDHPNDDWVKEV